MNHILIVEDNEGIVSFLQSELELEGYTTSVAANGREGIEKFNSESPDLVLLDIMLPELSGNEVLRRIRKISKTPVIFLTAKDGTDDKVIGLNSGADDYITKPFKIEELLARIGAVLRRTETSGSQIISNGEICLNSGNMEVSVSGNKIELSKTEYQLLYLFMKNPDVVLSRDRILDEVWGRNHAVNPNNLDIYISYLRTKIAEHTKEEYIQTVRGVGFKMKEPYEKIT